MAYGDFKDLSRRISFDKILRDMMDINVDLLQLSINFLTNKYPLEPLHLLASETLARQKKFTIKNEIISNKELAEKLQKPIIRKLNKRKVPSSFIDNIWDAELPYMHLIRNFNEGFKFLLRVIDIYSKYAWVIPLKDKKGITITNAFQKMLGESKHKPNIMSVDRDNEFHNRSMKSWLEKNAVEMHSARNEGKSVVAERFIRILKNIISKSKNVYIDKLNDIVNKYNNIYHSTIKMKPVDVNLSTHIDSSKEVNDKDPKFKFDNVVRISKYKNIFAKA